MTSIYKFKIPKIIQLGNPILREKAKEVKIFQDDKIRKLIDKLIKIVMAVDGVGIAAPQLGKSLRIFIMASHPNPRYPNAPQMDPTAIISPKIISLMGKKEKDWEGCLSIPGIRALVSRYPKVDTEFIDLNGKLIKKTFTGFLARIFQHEYDHLEGFVFLDRVENSKDIITESEYQKLMKKKNTSRTT